MSHKKNEKREICLLFIIHLIKYVKKIKFYDTYTNNFCSKNIR